MKITIKSKLEEAAPLIFQAANWQSAKALLIEYIKESDITLKDKNKMLDDVNKLSNFTTICTYFTNSLLKYEGMSLTKNKK